MKDLKEILKIRKQYGPLYLYLNENLPSIYGSSPMCERIIDRVLLYVSRNNYLQILYTYKIETLSVLLSYYLDIEDYASCISIRDTVNDHNKVTGECLKLVG